MIALEPFPYTAVVVATMTTLEIWQVAATAFIALVVLQASLYVLLYRRPRIDEALVRTGLGDVRVAVSSGIFVLPVVHKLKRVYLSEHKVEYSFDEPHTLRWQGGERFEGSIMITTQIPAESTNHVVQAARSIADTQDTDAIATLLEGICRSTCRDSLRTMRRITFDIEPAAVEMRLTQALDLAATAFGLRVRAVHLYDKITDTGRIRRAMAHIDGISQDVEASATKQPSSTKTEHTDEDDNTTT